MFRPDPAEESELRSKLKATAANENIFVLLIELHGIWTYIHIILKAKRFS